MNRHQNRWTGWDLKDLSARFRNTDAATKERVEGRASQCNDEPGMDEVQLGRQPPGAALDLARIRFGVQPALAALLKLEMLDRIGNIATRSVDACLVKALVQQQSSGADKRPAGDIFTISRLFTNEDNRRALCAFPEHQLRCRFVEVATMAAGDLFAEVR